MTDLVNIGVLESDLPQAKKPIWHGLALEVLATLALDLVPLMIEVSGLFTNYRIKTKIVVCQTISLFWFSILLLAWCLNALLQC